MARFEQGKVYLSEELNNDIDLWSSRNAHRRGLASSYFVFIILL